MREVSMSRLVRSLAGLGLALALTGSASADDFFGDLFRGSGTRDPQGRYQEDSRKAQQEYYQNVQRAQQNYHNAIRKAEQDFYQDRYRSRNQRDQYRSYERYQDRTQSAQRTYYDRLSRAQQEYQRDMQKARDDYYRNQDRYRRDIYDDWQRGNNRFQDDWRRRQHLDEWNRRRPNHYPTYGYDHGDYYYDREIYGRYDHAQPYDRGQVTYWSDGRGGTGYYRPHEDSYWQNPSWNLSVNLGVPGNHGYVNYDPYTYGRGGRYPHEYYRDYRWQDQRLRYQSEPSFRLAAGNDYYGDSYLYGSLYFPIR
jgi:hypothetical protein